MKLLKLVIAHAGAILHIKILSGKINKKLWLAKVLSLMKAPFIFIKEAKKIIF